VSNPRKTQSSKPNAKPNHCRKTKYNDKLEEYWVEHSERGKRITCEERIEKHDDSEGKEVEGVSFPDVDAPENKKDDTKQGKPATAKATLVDSLDIQIS
jgi:hypothetical protein